MPCCAHAQRRTGRDFGDTSFVEPLQRLLTACVEEASLSLVGRMATRWDVLRFLTNLLRFQAAERSDPGILNQTIRQPIFITGLPRSGTTFLHRLLMEDPENCAPLVWQTIYPYPLSKAARGGRDARPSRVARQLRAFEKLAPDFRGLHPLDAQSPQECSEITAHVFRSLRFDPTYRIPIYRALARCRRPPAGLRISQALSPAPAASGWRHGRWVVKCPDHLFALNAIRCGLSRRASRVRASRSSKENCSSVAKLTQVLRRPFTRRLDPGEIGGTGKQPVAGMAPGEMTAVGDNAGLPEPVHHVQHKALVSDPVGTVAALYRHFGLTLAPSVAAALGRYAENGRTAATARAPTVSRITGLTPDRSARNSAAT